MRVYNQDKTEILENPDLERGHIITDSMPVLVHAAEAVPEVYHYETLRTYKNGGKDVRKVVDVPGKPAVHEHYEDVHVLVYVPYTESELNDIRHVALKAELEKVKEDIEQVEYGLVRDDYQAKKARAIEIINELRVLEGKEPREISSDVL